MFHKLIQRKNLMTSSLERINKKYLFFFFFHRHNVGKDTIHYLQMTALLSPPTLHRLLTYSPSDTDLDVTSVICFRPTITFPTFPDAKICVETYGSISPARKYVKYKTELCRNGLSCRYGKDCQYAHSPQELRKVKLSELVNAGLIDAETYRVKPCDIFVMTGSW